MDTNGKKIYFEAFYIWKGKKPRFQFICDKVENVFIKAHNDWADLIRPYSDTWNNEYRGPDDLFDDEGYFRKPEDSEELRYYKEKYRSMAKKLKPKRYSLFIDHFDVGDELELLAIMRNGSTISVAFKEVSYEEVLKN